MSADKTNETLNLYQKEVQDFLKKEYPNDGDSAIFIGLWFKWSNSKKLQKFDKKDLKYFHKLFAEHNEHFDVVLWNSLFYTFFGEGASLKNFDEDEFSAEERAFVEKFYAAFEEQEKFYPVSIGCRYPNQNAGIKTERLLLRGLTVEDYLELGEKLRSEGDFRTYCGDKKPPSNEMERYLPCREDGFALENKQTKEFMGYVSISPNDADERLKVYNFKWYLFKKFRGGGYMEEALSALKDKAFAGELKTGYETEKKYVYASEPVEVNLVRTEMAAYDKESIETAQKAGLQHEATIHNYRYDFGVGPVDVEIYYAKNPNLIKK
ncbi:MAG TPA: hypothetical protein DEQ88_03065 [Clostridiales bacterium]|nr:hypothetical protein [Clostridiales bacterium]